MLSAEAQRRIAALRQPGPSARLARALWVAWAVIVWNVVFDHVIVVAGRAYIAAAERAAATAAFVKPPAATAAFVNPAAATAAFVNPAAATAAFVNMDDWMRPAVTRGLWMASASAGAIFVAGLLLVRVASQRGRPCA